MSNDVVNFKVDFFLKLPCFFFQNKYWTNKHHISSTTDTQ